MPELKVVPLMPGISSADGRKILTMAGELPQRFVIAGGIPRLVREIHPRRR